MKLKQSPKWNELNRQIVACERCTRLRSYCLRVAAAKRATYQEWDYWGLPVPNFGDPQARLLLVGLAPAAHGGNRTGRVFTGDRSGDWLYRALFKAGFANQAESVRRDDGLQLIDCAITNPCHCAPPENKPTNDELKNCSEWLRRTISILPVKVMVALGQTAWQSSVDHLLAINWLTGRKPKFAHGSIVPFDNSRRWLIGSFHPSPRNTFTKKLTEPMFDKIFQLAREYLDRDHVSTGDQSECGDRS